MDTTNDLRVLPMAASIGTDHSTSAFNRQPRQDQTNPNPNPNSNNPPLKQVLKKIFQECNERPTEVQVVPIAARYNVALNSPDGLLTIEQTIVVDNDQAFNCLIEKCGIERCTLHNTMDIAEQTCFIGE